MRRWGQRAGVALAMGAVVAALVVGAPVMAFADDAAPPPGATPTTEPAPGDPAPPSSTTPPADTPPADTPPADTPPATTTPATDPPTTTAPPVTDAPTTDVPAPAPANSDPPATQLTPVVTVTPSTALVNLQTVTVSGSGFTPNSQVGWAECKTGGTIAADCDVNRAGFGPTDATGSFSATYTVHRILHTANGDFDCASGVDACRVAAAKLSDYSESAGAVIDFDPSVPLPPPPTLQAAPTDGLVDAQAVAVFGGGFPANSPVSLQQCVTATPTICGFVGGATAGADGGFISLATVHRTIVSPPFSSVDCASAAGACELVATSALDIDARNSVALTFDPGGPLPSTAIQVTPDSSLVQFQSVSVTGSGFSGGGSVQAVECKTDPQSYEDCNFNAYQFAPITPAGTFTLTFSVRRVLHLPGGDFDCASAVGACSIVAASFGLAPAVASAPLDFDASVPLPPAPSLSVSPDTDLIQGQNVTVSGDHFAPNAFVQLGECTTNNDQNGYCFGIDAFVQADATGSFSTNFAVRRGVLDFTNYPPSVVDCASAPQTCSIQAFADGGDTAAAPIDFDPSVPIAVPTVTVDPQFGLADRALVHVHSSGFAPGERVVVSQCDADAPTAGISCTSGGVNVLIADANGVVDTWLRVHRPLTYPGGIVIVADTANCAEAVGECVIRAQSLDDPLVVKDVPLGFDPTAVAPPPVISTSPAGPYTDGEQVVVHGSGFTPGATLGLAQCEAGVEPNGHTCDSQAGGLFDQFTADGNGEFTRTITMHTQVQSTDSTIDCATSGSCVLFAANRQDYGAERAAMPITFTSGTAGAGAPPGPTIEVKGESATRALAFTGAGARTVPLAVTGFAFLLVGGALLLVSRRRRVSA